MKPRAKKLPSGFRGRNHLGEKFGRLLVVSYESGKKRSDGRRSYTTWRCKCDCGKTVSVRADHLRSGNSVSCGCYIKQKLVEMHTTHGLTIGRVLHPVYRSQRGMINRCTYPYLKDWRWYGGRGVKICEGWSDAATFIRDMKDSWFKRATIDRIKPKGHYSCGKCRECRAKKWPMNCRWVTWKEQAHNRTNNVKVTWRGEKKLLIVWAEERGIPYDTLYHRIVKAKWPVGKALTSPVLRRGPVKQP